QLKISNNSLSTLNQSFEFCCQQLEKLNLEVKVVQAEFLKLDEYKETVADYRLILSLKQLMVDSQIVEKRIGEGEVYVSKTLGERQKAQENLEALKQRSRDLKSELPDLTKLSDVREWFFKREHIERAISLSKSRIQQLNTQASEIVSLIKEQLSLDLLKGIEERSFPDYHKDQVENLRKESRLKQEQIQSQINHYHLQIRLGEFSSQLVSGKACMLCGSDHHSKIL